MDRVDPVEERACCYVIVRRPQRSPFSLGCGSREVNWFFHYADMVRNGRDGAFSLRTRT